MPFRKCKKKISAQLRNAYILTLHCFCFPRQLSSPSLRRSPKAPFESWISKTALAPQRRSNLWWSCKSLIWVYGLRSRDRVTTATLFWWGRSSSSSPSSSPCPRTQNGSSWLQVLLLQVKAVLQTSFCCHDLQLNQRQSFHFGFAQACHFNRRRKTEWILQEDHQPTNLTTAVLRWSKRNHSVSCRSRLSALHEC